jgi:hypothetical protein
MLEKLHSFLLRIITNYFRTIFKSLSRFTNSFVHPIIITENNGFGVAASSITFIPSQRNSVKRIEKKKKKVNASACAHKHVKTRWHGTLIRGLALFLREGRKLIQFISPNILLDYASS